MKDPDCYFQLLDEEASGYYPAIRDGLLQGVTSNDGSIGWAEFFDKVHQADRTAREIVETELIYLPPEDDQLDTTILYSSSWTTRPAASTENWRTRMNAETVPCTIAKGKAEGLRC